MPPERMVTIWCILLTHCSFSLTTFSPSGKLVQIEHALAAVAGGTTSLGIKGEPSSHLRACRTLELRSIQRKQLTHHSHEWYRPCNREESAFALARHLDDREGRHDLPQHRFRLLWHGSRLQSVGCQSEEDCSGILEGVWGVPTNKGTSAGSRWCHAEGNTVWVSGILYGLGRAGPVSSQPPPWIS